jgi:4-amino-4-deoxy-L-arabinose transferase-like glycosyltransferase
MSNESDSGLMEHRDLRPLLAVLAAGLLARIAVIAPGFGTLSDPDMYLPIARSLAAGRGYCIWDGIPTANRPPLYPILLAPIAGILDGRLLPYGIAALHVALGLGTVALTYLTARRWGYSSTRSTLAAAIVALDPVALVQSRVVMTETLAAFLVAACLAATTLRGRRGAILSGLAFGLGALCRPSLLPGAALVGLAWLTVAPGDRRGRAVGVGLFALGVVAVLSPWAVRNAIRFGQPIWTTTHGGYTLALANNPEYYADVVDGPPGAVWSGPNQDAWFDRVARATAGMTPTEADRYFQREGLRMLRERPTTFLRASIARLGRFWGVAPSALVYGRGLRLATAAWTVPLWIALACGLLRRDAWRWPAIVAPLLILGLTGVHTFYWTDMRMRVPVLPAIALIAAGASLPGRNGGVLGKLRWSNRGESLV